MRQWCGAVVEGPFSGTWEQRHTPPIYGHETDQVCRRLLPHLSVLGPRYCSSLDLQVLPAHSACAHRLHCCQETWFVLFIVCWVTNSLPAVSGTFSKFKSESCNKYLAAVCDIQKFYSLHGSGQGTTFVQIFSPMFVKRCVHGVVVWLKVGYMISLAVHMPTQCWKYDLALWCPLLLYGYS